MRTNIDIDDAVLDAAMKAGPFKTKKDAVQAGLKLLAHQAHCREVLRWGGKWQWDAESTVAPVAPASPAAADPGADAAALGDAPAALLRTGAAAASSAVQAHEPARKRHDVGH